MGGTVTGAFLSLSGKERLTLVIPPSLTVELLQAVFGQLRLSPAQMEDYRPCFQFMGGFQGTDSRGDPLLSFLSVQRSKRKRIAAGLLRGDALGERKVIVDTQDPNCLTSNDGKELVIELRRDAIFKLHRRDGGAEG